jgi:DNA-binding PadR family transcriptional regulator
VRGRDQREGSSHYVRAPESFRVMTPSRMAVLRYTAVRTRSIPVTEDLQGFGRYSGPATLILSSLADGDKHGYALTKDIEAFARVHLAPGTLYAALDRLVEAGLAVGLEAEGRRRPYRLTAFGAEVLRAHLEAQRNVVNIGLRRLSPRTALS